MHQLTVIILFTARIVPSLLFSDKEVENLRAKRRLSENEGKVEVSLYHFDDGTHAEFGGQ